MGSALITVEFPVDVSNVDLEAYKTYLMENLTDFTPRSNAISFVFDEIRSAIAFPYTYNDTDLGLTYIGDVFYRIGDRVSNMKYQADPSTFPVYLPIFEEMLDWIVFAPTTSQSVGVNPESACFNADSVSVLSCLPQNANPDPQAGRAISNLLNTQPCIACL
jgi:hypothetical protein